MENPEPTMDGDAAAAETAAPAVETVRHEVSIVRTVRYGRVLIGAAVLGAVVLAIASLIVPADPEAEYTLAQVVGFMALIGAVLGLALGAVVSIILAASVKRRHGSGVAIQTDVR